MFRSVSSAALSAPVRRVIASHAAICMIGLFVARQDATCQSTAVLDSVPVDTLLAARSFAPVRAIAVSPDGGVVAYVLRADNRRNAKVGFAVEVRARTGVGWEAMGARIWIVDRKTGVQRGITPASADSWMPTWSPDGRYLAFISDGTLANDAAVARVWVWDRASGKISRVSDRPIRPDPLFWGNDGRRLLVTFRADSVASPPLAGSPSGRHVVAPDDAPAPGSTVAVYRGARDSASNTAYGDPWSLADPPADLAWVTLTSGHVQRIAHLEKMHHVELAPDGVHVAYTVAKRFERAGLQQVLWDLVVADSLTTTTVAPDVRLLADGAQFSWAPDSRRIAYRAEGKLADGGVYLLAPTGGEPRRLTLGADTSWKMYSSHQGPLWDARGDHVFFMGGNRLWRATARGDSALPLAVLGKRDGMLVAQHGNVVSSPDGGTSTIVVTVDKANGRGGLARVDLVSGVVTQLREEDKYYGAYRPEEGFAVSPDGRVFVFTTQDVAHGPELYALDPDLHAARRLTAINPSLERYEMGDRRIIEWRTIDGDTVHGLLLLPAGYQSGRRYPLITWVYGGSQPTQTSTNQFGLTRYGPWYNLQLYATRNYAVLAPDIPLTKPGQVTLDLMKVVLPGVDKVVELGIADPARLALTGHSFGAFNTITLLTETTRFRAAMMADGGADLVASYGAMGPDGTTYGIGVVENGQFLMHGTPWEQPARYVENSPIFHLDRVTTPLLIVHGAADNAVASFLGDEVFVGLRRLGKDVEYAKYAGEGHDPQSWSYANQVDVITRTLKWFDTHLGAQRVSERQ